VLPARRLAVELDMQLDSIDAALSYLEADARPALRTLPAVAAGAKVCFYAAPAEEMAAAHPVVGAVLAACPNPRAGVYAVATPRLAAAAQRPPGVALQELQAMAAARLVGFELTGEQGPAYEVLAAPAEAELPRVAARLHRRLSAMLACQVGRLDTAYRAFAAAARAGEAGGGQEAQEAALRAAMAAYFEAPEARAEAPRGAAAADAADAPFARLGLEGLPLRPADPSLITSARAILRLTAEQGGGELTACAIARVLHGTGSPAMPRGEWQKRMGAFWGSHRSTDFAAVLAAAKIARRVAGAPEVELPGAGGGAPGGAPKELPAWFRVEEGGGGGGAAEAAAPAAAEADDARLRRYLAEVEAAAAAAPPPPVPPAAAPVDDDEWEDAV
jgi:ATP-dependent DNA helicase Q4